MNRQMDQMIEQNRALTVSIEKLQEQIAILTQHRFGRRTEKTSEIPSEQMTIADLLLGEMRYVFNEAEATMDESTEEPELEEITYRRKRRKGKRDEDLSGIEVVVDDPEVLY